MSSLLRHLSQVLCYALFAMGIGYFSVAPEFQYASPEVATAKLAFSHAAERVVPCQQLSPEEVAALAPNMRRTESCERARLPLIVELRVDNELVLTREAPPAGLWGDGPASVYEKLDLAPGTYTFDVRLRDSARDSGWDYSYAQEVSLVAGRYVSITFKAETGGFEIR